MKTYYIYILSLIFSPALSAATIQINWSTDRMLINQGNFALSAGTAINGDGTLLQLGYYTAATSSNPFAGVWRVLAASSIGDTDVNQAGMFSTTTTLVEGSFAPPSIGSPLAIRFYNGLTAATSTFFNAASDTTGAWNWVAPGDPAPVLNLQITKLTGVFQTGVIGAFETRISTGVPEPSTAALLLGTCLSLLVRRKRA